MPHAVANIDRHTGSSSLFHVWGKLFYTLSYSMHIKLFLSISLLSVVWITYSCTHAIMVFGASAVGCNENLILFQYLGCVY